MVFKNSLHRLFALAFRVDNDTDHNYRFLKELSRPSPMSKRKRDDDLIVEGELITQILDSMGVQSYEGTVVPQLIEVMHRYSEEVLKDAYDYALHTGRKSTEMGDLKVALKIRDLNPAIPSRAAMTSLALEVNKKPLPPINGVTGLRLPPQELTLLNRPFRVVSSVQPEA